MLVPCSNCGHEVSEDAEQCPQCSEKNFQSAICLFCKKRDYKTNLSSNKVYELTRAGPLTAKFSRGIKKEIFFHEKCKKKYLSPKRKSIKSNCSECGKMLNLEIDDNFNFKNIDICPNCGSPRQPKIPKAKSYDCTKDLYRDCNICGNDLIPKFQSISRTTENGNTISYHTICGYKAGIGIFDLGRGRNIIVLIIIFLMLTWFI